MDSKLPQLTYHSRLYHERLSMALKKSLVDQKLRERAMELKGTCLCWNATLSEVANRACIYSASSSFVIVNIRYLIKFKIVYGKVHVS